MTSDTVRVKVDLDKICKLCKIRNVVGVDYSAELCLECSIRQHNPTSKTRYEST